MYAIIIATICIIRVHAIFDRNNKILIVLVAALLAETAFSLYIALSMAKFRGASSPPIELTDRFGCGLTFLLSNLSGAKKLAIAGWILTTANSGLYLSLSLFKLGSSLVCRSERSLLYLWKDRSTLSPVGVAFLMSSVLAFLQLTLMHSICVALSIIQGGRYHPVFWPWMYSINSYTGCRLILELRRAERRGDDAMFEDEVDVIPLSFANVATTQCTSR